MFSTEDNGVQRLLFGVSLSELFNSEPQHPEFEIPMFIASVVLFLDTHGHVPGIFKQKVDNSEIEDLMRGLESGERVETNNPHAVAGLLLSFLVYLPEPVLVNNYSQYITAARKGDVIALQQLVHHLPPAHYLILRAILLLLHHLSVDQSISDVGTTDLAQIVAPLLLMGPVSSMEVDMEEIITLGELLIEEYDIILAPLAEEDYVALTGPRETLGSVNKNSSNSNPNQPSTSTSTSSPTLSLAPFQRSKYSVNYEINFSSLSPQKVPLLAVDSAPTSKSTISHGIPAYPSSSSSPSKFTPPVYRPLDSPSTPSPPPLDYRSSSPTVPTAYISPLLSRKNVSSVAIKTEPSLIGIYGSEPDLKYVESNEKLRQLDSRFEEMVEDMQEKRSLFLHQIDSIRKRMVLSTPELRWAPPPLPTRSSPSPSHSRQSRTPPPRTPPPSHPSRPPSTPPSQLSQLVHNSGSRSASPAPAILPSTRSSSTSRSQSPLALDPPPPLSSPTFHRLSPAPSPLLHSLSGDKIAYAEETQSDNESDETDIEQMLRNVRSEARDNDSLHNYYYGKMTALYVEVQTLKSTIRDLQKEADSHHVERLELKELLHLKDERIKKLEGDQEKPKGVEIKSPYQSLLPPERKAPSPPIARRL